MWRWYSCSLSACLLVLVGGCAALHVPENATATFALEQASAPAGRLPLDLKTTHFQASLCPPPGTTGFIVPAGPPKQRSSSKLLTMRYSTGDRFNLQVPGAGEYSGDYVVNADGRVLLPFAEPIVAIGLTNDALANRIERALLRARLFREDQFRVSVRPVLYSAINVTVSGAVFLPGRFVINARENDKYERSLAKSGDSPIDRFLAAALRSAGGVRPDADLSSVILVRDGKRHRLDWRGALTGNLVDDVALIEGDHIHVEETTCFQSALVRPSQITPPGLRIFVSNLTAPAASNAQANITHHATSIPYGTRLLSGFVSANCVGGSLASNARRYGVLISRNPKTQETQVVQRSIEELILSADRDAINPFLMPDDAIACYDSAVTDVKEVSTLLQQLVLPFTAGGSAAAAVITAKAK